MITLGDEDDLLADVKEGVEIAMQRRGYDASDIDSIKFNKLAYHAVREYDVPITYGWYKYGPAPANVARRSVEVRPRPATDVPAVEEPRIHSANYDGRSPEEYSYFFSEDLSEFEDVLETPTKEYLVRFYFEYAPDQYRDLYIAAAELQQTLDDIRADSSWHHDGETYVDRLREQFGHVLTEIASNPVLDESLKPMREYEDVVVEIASVAAARSDLTEPQQRFLRRVVDYFYGGAWNYVALLVSRDTVELSPGTNGASLRNSIEEDLRELRNEYDTELARLAERAKRFDLRSESQDVTDESGSDSPRIGAETTAFDESDTASMEDVMERLE